MLAQQATLNATQATLPGLQKQLAQQRNQLTALAGRFPSQEVSQTFDLASLQLPEDLPLSLPSKLVQQRPDIQAAQAQLHSASAQVGVAVANMLPQFTINASWATRCSISRRCSPAPGIWSLGVGLTHADLPRRRSCCIRSARPKRPSMPRRRSTAARVITAFQNVADTLRALQSDADALAARSRGGDLGLG